VRCVQLALGLRPAVAGVVPIVSAAGLIRGNSVICEAVIGAREKVTS